MTASAAGSGAAVCPSTAAGGAVIFFLCTAAGSGFFWARRLLRLGQSLLVLRLRCLLELVVRLLPLLSWCAWHTWSYAESGGFPL